ncbi:hypothetical protein [Nocardia amamiensis]|uniref:hypothetical protein n=1 Tax=Nocardia amamiensis TaxID=404578 RepID=UPI0033F0AD45
MTIADRIERGNIHSRPPEYSRVGTHAADTRDSVPTRRDMADQGNSPAPIESSRPASRKRELCR